MIKITATYVIDHPQPPKDLPLTFITGVQSISGVKCSWNGMPLAFTTKQVVNMPDSWKPPAETPGFVPDERLLYSQNISDTQHEWILFTVPLQTGRQSIEVMYEVEAGAYYSEYYSAKFWQTAYILAPARTWKSCGGLELEVFAPENWLVKCNLPLVNQGQQWTASFDSLPADYIALTTQHPNGKRVLVIGLMQSLYLFGMMTLLIGLRHLIRRYRQVKQTSNLVNQPPCTHHTSMSLFLLSFLPLAWNTVLIATAKSDVPVSQDNYQLFVIFVIFQGVYWLLFLAPLMLLSRLVLGLFCLFGSWLGKHSLMKRKSGVCPTQS